MAAQESFPQITSKRLHEIKMIRPAFRYLLCGRVYPFGFFICLVHLASESVPLRHLGLDWSGVSSGEVLELEDGDQNAQYHVTT